jgi:hypothetical protein
MPLSLCRSVTLQSRRLKRMGAPEPSSGRGDDLPMMTSSPAGR